MLLPAKAHGNGFITDGHFEGFQSSFCLSPLLTKQDGDRSWGEGLLLFWMRLCMLVSSPIPRDFVIFKDCGTCYEWITYDLWKELDAKT